MIKQNHYWILVICFLVLTGCDKIHLHDHSDHKHGETAHHDHAGHGHDDHDHDEHEGHDHDEHDEGHAVAVTQWGQQSEIFMEYEPLIAGKESSFLIHLTKLSDYSAVTEAEVTLHFTDQEGKVWKFFASQPIREGIFKPLALIRKSGEFLFKINVSGPQVEDEFDLGKVTVYANLKNIPHAEESHSDNAISFLKEQQWQGAFNVKEAKLQKLSPVVKTQGKVRAPVNATRTITAPISGKLTAPATGLPLLGSFISSGQKLAEVHDATSSQKIDILSPVSGVIASVYTKSGDTVESGWKVLEMIDLTKVWIEAEVYEPDIPRIKNSKEAIIQVPGSGKKIISSSLVSMGAMMDQSSRTLPVIFEVPNSDGLFKVGASVSIEIKTGMAEEKIALPKSSLIDIDGKWVAYVQTGGESFEERTVTVGEKEGDWVEIRKGIKVGEYVVSEGAYTIRLTSSSSDIPAHGHAH